MELEASRKHFLLIQVTTLINAMEMDLHYDYHLPADYIRKLNLFYVSAKRFLNMILRLPSGAHDNQPRVIRLMNALQRTVRAYARLSNTPLLN